MTPPKLPWVLRALKRSQLLPAAVDKLKGDIRVSSDVNDDLNVGVEYDHHGNENPIRAVIAKVSQWFVRLA